VDERGGECPQNREQIGREDCLRPVMDFLQDLEVEE